MQGTSFDDHTYYGNDDKDYSSDSTVKLLVALFGIVGLGLVVLLGIFLRDKLCPREQEEASRSDRVEMPVAETKGAGGTGSIKTVVARPM